MAKIAYMSDYRKPESSMSINVECKLDSKKACELLQDDELRALLHRKDKFLIINNQGIEILQADIYTELAKRD